MRFTQVLSIDNICRGDGCVWVGGIAVLVKPYVLKRIRQPPPPGTTFVRGAHHVLAFSPLVLSSFLLHNATLRIFGIFCCVCAYKIAAVNLSRQHSGGTPGTSGAGIHRYVSGSPVHCLTDSASPLTPLGLLICDIMTSMGSHFTM